MAAFVVGLTGGIASGKSTVAEHFAVLGVPVIDADAVAREVVTPGEPALAQLVAAFGEDIVTSEGELDRARLREAAFSDDGHRRQLEAILHPAIGERMQQRINEADSPYVIQMVPLLVETGGHQLVDRVLVVDAPESTQIERVTARDNVPAEQAEAILRAQADRDHRLAHADDVIVNDGDPEHLAAWVTELHQAYLEMARDPAARKHRRRFGAGTDRSSLL